MFEYSARPIRVIDGDTVEMNIDLGLHVHINVTLRLIGIDTPELRSSDPVERSRAKEARDFVANRLGLNGGAQPLVRVRTTKPRTTDKYGRFLAEILYTHITEDVADRWQVLNTELINTGLARAYNP